MDPSCRYQIPVDPNKRILELESYLDPKSPDFMSEQEHENVKTAIRLYKEGTIDGSNCKQVCVNEGKVMVLPHRFPFRHTNNLPPFLCFEFRVAGKVVFGLDAPYY
jgi:hypothetical protein